MIEGNITGLGFNIPSPAVNWVRPWDTIATIAILLAVWFLYNYIIEMPDDEGGEDA